MDETAHADILPIMSMMPTQNYRNQKRRPTVWSVFFGY